MFITAPLLASLESILGGGGGGTRMGPSVLHLWGGSSPPPAATRCLNAPLLCTHTHTPRLEQGWLGPPSPWGEPAPPPPTRGAVHPTAGERLCCPVPQFPQLPPLLGLGSWERGPDPAPPPPHFPSHAALTLRRPESAASALAPPPSLPLVLAAPFPPLSLFLLVEAGGRVPPPPLLFPASSGEA